MGRHPAPEKRIFIGVNISVEYDKKLAAEAIETGMDNKANLVRDIIKKYFFSKYGFKGTEPIEPIETTQTMA